VNIEQLPAVNATLNLSSAVLLFLGWRAIRAGRVPAHRALMLCALGVSLLFLVSYLVYHYAHGSTRFQGQGPIRPVYFAVLISHTVLAAALVPLVVTAVSLALRKRFERHRRWARITWPIWMYVSTTGVLIYLMLYQWFPGPGG
jgi:uncharacterized membrane protein YozB (DUF420 family)